MADETNNTQQQDNGEKDIRGHVLTPDQLSEWGNDTVMVEPNAAAEDGSTQQQGVTNDADDDTTDDAQDEDVAEDYQEQPELQAVEDPGAYAPKDYSFEVVTYDDEGKHPKVNKVKSLDEWETLVDSDPNFGTSGALLKAQRLATKMEYGEERDQAEWQRKKDAYDEYGAKIQANVDRVNAIAAEINYLVTQGKLPAADPKYDKADWRDPEVAKQPGVKEQVELLNYMRKENDARRKAGLSTTVSAIDAYNAMQLERRDKTDKTERKQASERRKQAGARIASQSPAPMSSNAPKGIAVGRGGSLRDIDQGWGQ